MTDSLIQIPSGVQCFYGREALLRRTVERRVAEVFAGWSYEEILLPLFDYYEVFDRGGGPSGRGSIYRFIGRQGELLALRPDFTALVAKVVQSRMQSRPLPLRLFYSGEVLRYQPPKPGRQEELFQIGLEHIGTGVRGDLEVLLIALEAMERLGVRDAIVTIGHAGFVLGLLEAAGTPQAAQTELLGAMRARDPDALRRSLGSEPPPELLEALRLGGGIEVLRRARAVASEGASRSAVDDLEALGEELHAVGVAEHVQFDLGEVRGFDYYTGMVFEIHAPGSGLELGGGGRYDSLLGKFGSARPAVGFSFSLDRLAQLITASGAEWVSESPAEALAAPGQPAELFGRARALRRQGRKVRVE